MAKGDRWSKRLSTMPKIGILVILAATTMVFLATRASTQEATSEIPNCAVGSLKTQGIPPEAGSPEWDAMTFEAPREAAESMFVEYREAGRVDGRDVESTELGVIDELTYFVPYSDNPGLGDVLFVVEEVGGRYAVLHMEFCAGAEPADAVQR